MITGIPALISSNQCLWKRSLWLDSISQLLSRIFEAVTLQILQYTWKICQKWQTKRWAALTWNWHAHFKPSPSSLHTPPYLHDDSSHTLTSDSLTFNSEKNIKRRQKRNIKIGYFEDNLALKPSEHPSCLTPIQKLKEKCQSCSPGMDLALPLGSSPEAGPAPQRKLFLVGRVVVANADSPQKQIQRKDVFTPPKFSSMFPLMGMPQCKMVRHSCF